MTDTFPKVIVQSVIAHVALVLILTLRALTMPSEPIVIHDSIRVDVVGLPDKIQEIPHAPAAPTPATPPPVEAKPAPKAEPVKPKPIPAPTVNLTKKATPAADVSKKERSALDSIKAMAALDKIKSDVAKSKPVRGNIVATGNSLTGESKAQFDKYFSGVEDRIRQNWSLPEWLIDAHLRGQALVLIDASGIVKKKQIMRSSGNDEFDNRMLDAIDKSSPFPAPPDRLRDVLGTKGIVFNFPQRGES